MSTGSLPVLTSSLPTPAILFRVVWCILALELVFEYLIRPFDYGMLVESDQAYAPSTARHINLYHLAFETIALMLFIPEFSCMYKDRCGAVVPFSDLWASVYSVDGSDSGKAVLSRLCLGLTSLRLFGLVRHWKQMWINNTFTDKSRSNLIRRFLLLEYESKGKDGMKVSVRIVWSTLFRPLRTAQILHWSYPVYRTKGTPIERAVMFWRNRRRKKIKD